MPEISLHGRALRLDTEKCGFVTPRISKGLIRQFRITTAQLLALFATPVEILPATAVGAGKTAIVRGVNLYKPAGTAYAGIAVGEDLAVKYTNSSGSIASTIEATGFLDSASATRAFGGPSASCVPVANAALVLHMLTGEIITGTSDLYGWLEYDVYPFALDQISLT